MFGIGQKLTDEQLRKHMLDTYFSLRVGMAIIGVALPIMLLIIAWALGLASHPTSAYLRAWRTCEPHEWSRRLRRP